MFQPFPTMVTLRGDVGRLSCPWQRDLNFCFRLLWWSKNPHRHLSFCITLVTHHCCDLMKPPLLENAYPVYPLSSSLCLLSYCRELRCLAYRCLSHFQNVFYTIKITHPMTCFCFAEDDGSKSHIHSVCSLYET